MTLLFAYPLLLLHSSLLSPCPLAFALSRLQDTALPCSHLSFLRTSFYLCMTRSWPIPTLESRVVFFCPCALVPVHLLLIHNTKPNYLAITCLSLVGCFLFAVGCACARGDILPMLPPCTYVCSYILRSIPCCGSNRTLFFLCVM